MKEPSMRPAGRVFLEPPVTGEAAIRLDALDRGAFGITPLTQGRR